MSLFVAMKLTRWLTALAVIQQTFELLEVQGLIKRFWPWEVLQSDYPKPLRPLLGLLLGNQAFIVVLWVRLVSGMVLLFFSSLPALLVLLTTSYLINMRWRGTYNGGSDVMTFLLLSTLTAGELLGPSTKILCACLWYIAVQSTLSYFLAGWVKIANPRWRSGKALSQFLRLHRVKVKLGPSAAWGIMLFEALFPLALLYPSLTPAFLLVAFLFHLANARLLGLNRFLTTWLATYPAILFASRTIWGP